MRPLVLGSRHKLSHSVPITISIDDRRDELGVPPTTDLVTLVAPRWFASIVFAILGVRPPYNLYG
jgi:hypothetical protein